MTTSGRPLTGRVALVTGANHGIGAAVAVALAQYGADVAATYLRAAAGQARPDQPAAYSEQRQMTAASTTAAVVASGVRALDGTLTRSAPPPSTRSSSLTPARQRC